MESAWWRRSTAPPGRPAGARRGRCVRGRAGSGVLHRLRIGLSTVKGLAFATGKPVVGVLTLDALAWRLPYCAYPVCPVLDARKNEVYTALYRTVTGRLEILEAPRAVAPATLAEELRDGTAGPVVFVEMRSGASARSSARSWRERACLAPADLRLPSAVTVGELGAWALERGEATDAASLVPLYVRPSEAELAPGARAGCRTSELSPCGATISTRSSRSSAASFQTPWSRSGVPARARAEPGGRAVGGARGAFRRGR